jgi:hypothetical protein
MTIKGEKMETGLQLENEKKALRRALGYAASGKPEDVNLAAGVLQRLRVAKWQDVADLARDYYDDQEVEAEEVVSLAEFLMESVDYYIQHPDLIPV